MASDLNKQMPVLTGARQTMSSWTKVIESWEAVPEAYGSSYKMALGNEALFPYTILAPAIAGLRHKTTEKLLCEVNDTILVWERIGIGNQVTMAEYRLKNISDFEVGEILLSSWITISGVTKAGVSSSTTVEFNTATRRHFARFLDRMRPTPDDMAEHEQDVEYAKFDYLAADNFKFMNYARGSLVHGEKVIRSLWQSKIRKPIVSLLGRTFYQTRSLAHLAILTDKELIIISDDERSRENRGVRYGGKWRYIPLSHINAVSLLDHADDLLALSLTLSPGGQRLEVVFAASQKEEVVQFQSELEKSLG